MSREDVRFRQRFVAGDPEAMETVFERCCEPLAQKLRAGFTFTSNGQSLRFRGLSDHHDLHDVVAETFRRAFEARAREAFRDWASYPSYLKTIARNLVIDRLRSKSAQWQELTEAMVEETALVAPTPSPEQAAQQSELTRLVREFTERLEPAERELIELRVHEGLSQEEAARRMDRTRRWVRKTEAWVRRRLLAHMKRTGYLPSRGDAS